MRLIFQLRFHTQPGQSLLVTGNHALLGNDAVESAIPLEYLNEEFWRVTIVFPNRTAPDANITYRYILRSQDGSILEDCGHGRSFNPASFKIEELLIVDSWNHPGSYENALYTEPFQTVLLKPRHTEVQSSSALAVTHLFRAKAPLLEKNQTLCLLGSTAALGNWNTVRPILLNRLAGHDWLTVGLDLTRESFPIEYKFGVYDVAQNRFLLYEDGANRTLNDVVSTGKQTIINDGFVALPSASWKGAGVAIPVFSLRTHSSFGTGEFTDLKPLADWCQTTGLKLIQLLPINDTIATHTAADSYPYAAISAFALHPLYLNLSQVASEANQILLREVEEERKRLNALAALDYEAVMHLKRTLAMKLYRSQGAQTFKSPQYKDFFNANKHWLVPYAVFSYLRDKYGTPDFGRWEQQRTCDLNEVATLSAQGSPAWSEIALNYFIQYHLHLQLSEATEYAHDKGIVLKGDLPIGVARHGVDAWQQPELYRMEMQAGAPPDAFGVKGQNWSFPTYDWPRMRKTGFAWWKQRLGQMGIYFDAFRIDHILGFFRIWSIPIHAVEGIMGHFVPAIPVNIAEFARCGISFNHDRYTKPFITDLILAEVFGEDANVIKAQFLQSSAPGAYSLKPEFATQRQVERYFAGLETSQHHQKLLEGLFDLISNVLLFDEEGSAGQQFHFRFSIESTSSFKNLDGQTQAQLRELYLDYFFRRQDDFWMKEAMQKLPALKRVTNMLVCGEDLGMVPACVPVAMKQLGLLSLEVQRMPKSLHHEFSHPKDAPYLSVVTPATHDMSTIRGWWTEDRHVVQRFYNHELGLPGPAPEQCEPWLNRSIVNQHLASPAMWSIFQLQDLLGMDQQLRRPNPAEERINVPADAKNYWRYRMHLWLEDLLQAGEYNGALRQDIERNGR